MDRRALIVFNPGEEGEENYCTGVTRDVASYRSFLLSPTGGLWRESEIRGMNRPSCSELRTRVEALSNYDYALVIFSGHGWHSEDSDSTILCLRRGQEIDSTELRIFGTRQTLILDCCRVPERGLREDRVLLDMLAKAAPTLHPEDCRRYYDRELEKCADELIILYACGIGQTAADDAQMGGLYSHNLLRASSAWARSVDIDTSHEYITLSVVSAHEQAARAVERLRAGRQNPQIEKPRSSPYFPFCIVA